MPKKLRVPATRVSLINLRSRASSATNSATASGAQTTESVWHAHRLKTSLSLAESECRLFLAGPECHSLDRSLPSLHNSLIVWQTCIDALCGDTLDRATLAHNTDKRAIHFERGLELCFQHGIGLLQLFVAMLERDRVVVNLAESSVHDSTLDLSAFSDAARREAGRWKGSGR